MKTDKERLAIMETNMSNMAKDITELKSSFTSDMSELKASVKIIANELPCKADKDTVDKQFANLSKSKLLQSITTGIITGAFGIMLGVLLGKL